MNTDNIPCDPALFRGEALFDAPYLVQTDLPKEYTIRPLCSNDFERGYMDVLRALTEKVGEHTKVDFLDQFHYMKKHNDTYYSIVITDATQTVVATGTILVERKFIHNNGKVGHIEDIAVKGDQQGKKLGMRIISALKHIGEMQGCYKVILDCSEKNVPFYEKCGFVEKEHQMAWYVPTGQPLTHPSSPIPSHTLPNFPCTVASNQTHGATAQSNHKIPLAP